LLTDEAKAYPSLSAVVSLFKLDCYDASEDFGVAAEVRGRPREREG
jgi:hypothetical protein